MRRPLAHVGRLVGSRIAIESRIRSARVGESRVRIRIPDPWDRDEWDVTLSDGATYRLFRERDADAWFLEGVVD